MYSHGWINIWFLSCELLGALPSIIKMNYILAWYHFRVRQTGFTYQKLIQGEAHKVLQSDSTQIIDHIQKCFRQKFQCSNRPSYWTTLFFYWWRRWSYVKVKSTFLNGTMYFLTMTLLPIEMTQKAFVNESMGMTQIKEWYRCCALLICSKRWDDQQRILRWSSKKIAWCCEKKTTVFLVKRWLASSPRYRASAFIEPWAAIFVETQDCTASPASVQSRHSSLRLFDVPKIENGAQRKAVRQHRDDSE